jgi:hypothetical protein
MEKGGQIGRRQIKKYFGGGGVISKNFRLLILGLGSIIIPLSMTSRKMSEMQPCGRFDLFI